VATNTLWQRLWLLVGRFDPFAKDVGGLNQRDFNRYPVWEFQVGAEFLPWRDETWLSPVKRLPVDSLDNRLVGTRLKLANGQTVRGILGNISLRNARATRQFIDVEISHNGKSYQLQRAASPMHPYLNAQGLADALGLRIEQVFPITYDLSDVAVGDPKVIKGSIEAELPENLSKDDQMKLILKSL